MTAPGTRRVLQLRAGPANVLKNTSRFPEFVDVGFDVFESIVDWLVSVQQPVTSTARPMAGTRLPFSVDHDRARPDFPDNYVGQGYDIIADGSGRWQMAVAVAD